MDSSAWINKSGKLAGHGRGKVSKSGGLRLRHDHPLRHPPGLHHRPRRRSPYPRQQKTPPKRNQPQTSKHSRRIKRTKNQHRDTKTQRGQAATKLEIGTEQPENTKNSNRSLFLFFVLFVSAMNKNVKWPSSLLFSTGPLPRSPSKLAIIHKGFPHNPSAILGGAL